MQNPFERRDVLKFAGLSASALLLPGRASASERTAMIMVDPAPRQRFVDFGVSHANNQNALLAGLPDAAVANALDLIDRTLPITIRHVWISGPFEWTVAQMVENFRNEYLRRDVIRERLFADNRQLLLTPSQNHVRPTIAIAQYASKVAETIARLAKEDGVPIAFTSISNEPNAFLNSDMVTSVIEVRAALDSLGLTHVGVVGPDVAAVTPATVGMVEAIKANPQAWKSLAAVTSHSYGHATNPALADAAAGKPIWVTEAGNSVESVGFGDPPGLLGGMDAATDAGRFLGDMNNMVSRWLWFVGLSASTTPKSNSAALIILDQTGAMTVYPRLEYLSMLMRTFPRGSVFRRCSSDLDGPMTWNTSRKPTLTAAYAVGPDGKARFGVVNASGVASDRWEIFTPPSRMDCSLQLPVRNTTFRLSVTTPDGKTRDGGRVAANASGFVQLPIDTLELVTAIEV